MKWIVIRDPGGRIGYEDAAELERKSKLLGEPVKRIVLAACHTETEAGILAAQYRKEARHARTEA